MPHRPAGVPETGRLPRRVVPLFADAVAGAVDRGAESAEHDDRLSAADLWRHGADAGGQAGLSRRQLGPGRPPLPVRGAREILTKGEGAAGRSPLFWGSDSLEDARSIRANPAIPSRSEAHTLDLKSLMRLSYAHFCLNKKNTQIY